MLPVPEKIAKSWRICRCRNDQDLTYSRKHQGCERIVDHGLVVHRHELLAHDLCRGPQARPGTDSENDSFSHAALNRARVSRSVRAARSVRETTMLADIHMRDRFTRHRITATERETMRFLLFNAFTSSASSMLRIRMYTA